MKILVVGGGGREHALVWKLAQSKKVSEIFVAPGNAGTAQIARNLDVSATDIPSLLKAAYEHRIDLTIVGPEAPLAKGIVDQFLIRGLQIFGPTKIAAQIESSKAFAKDLMQRNNIPCARSATFEDYGQAKDYISKQKPPIVVKADGLAAGKGVVVAASVDEALEALDDIMQKKSLGEAGNRVVIEEFLSGREMSSFAFSDAHSISMMQPACDYKRVFDNDKGPNTGGMGSYSPPFFYTPELGKTVKKNILAATVHTLHEEGKPYKGVLYGGLMITPEGPKVLEFNARFGDPETQVVLPRLETDLIDIMVAISDNALARKKITWSEDACVGVVMASGGYPGNYKTGLPVTGLNDVDKDVMIFHAGTKVGPDGQVLTAGGRVLVVAAKGRTVAEARGKVYDNLPRIRFEGCHYRKDIALKKE